LGSWRRNSGREGRDFRWRAATGRRTLNPDWPLAFTVGAKRNQPTEHQTTPDAIAKATIKALVLQVAWESGIPALDEDALISLTRLRQFREPVRQAVREYTPSTTRPVAAKVHCRRDA
jgi:hypothetical protein